MNALCKVAGAFLLALVACNTVASMAANWLSSPEFAFSSLQALWLDSKAGPELLEGVVLSVVFALGGTTLAAAMLQPFSRPGPAMALGGAYSVFLWLFLPWLPGSRDTVEPFWLLALASAPYYVPALASAAGAALFNLLARRQSAQHAA